MPSEEALLEIIDDKYMTTKEDLEEIINEVKNDVDEKTVQIRDNKRMQEQSFEQLHTAMEKLRKDLKKLGKLKLSTFHSENKSAFSQFRRQRKKGNRSTK